MDDYGSQTVQLYIYDLTQGMATLMSPLLLGKFAFSNKYMLF